MARAVLGHTSVIGLAEEVTWGTGVSATHWLPVISHSLEVEAPSEPVPILFAGNTSYHSHRNARNLVHDAGGDISGPVYYDHTAFLLLMKHAFGNVATTGSGPYDHTFLLATQGYIGLTGEAYYGSHASVSRAQVFAGSKVNTFEVECEARGMARFRASLISKSGSSLGAISGAASYTASAEALGHQFGTLTLGSTEHRLSRFGFRINNQYARRPYLGSKETDEPQPSDFAELTVFGRMDWVANQMYADFLAGTQQDASIVATGAGNNRITINLQNVILNAVTKPVDGPGGLSFEFEGRAYADASDRGISVVVRNDNSTAV